MDIGVIRARYGRFKRAPGGGHGERQGAQVRHIVMGMRSGW
jgi:hypothetical protein